MPKLTTQTTAAVAFHVTRNDEGQVLVAVNGSDKDGLCLSPTQALCLAASLLDKAAVAVAYTVDDAVALLPTNTARAAALLQRAQGKGVRVP